jgi:hypothetical protein
MAVVFIVISATMAFVPDRVAGFVKRSKGWRGYLRFFSGIETTDITAARLRIRLQGVVGLVFSVLLCIALWQRFAA